MGVALGDLPEDGGAVQRAAAPGMRQHEQPARVGKFPGRAVALVCERDAMVVGQKLEAHVDVAQAVIRREVGRGELGVVGIDRAVGAQAVGIAPYGRDAGRIPHAGRKEGQVVRKHQQPHPTLVHGVDHLVGFGAWVVDRMERPHVAVHVVDRAVRRLAVLPELGSQRRDARQPIVCRLCPAHSCASARIRSRLPAAIAVFASSDISAWRRASIIPPKADSGNPLP